jgi:hypothetical protein
MTFNWIYSKKQITTCDKLKINDVFYFIDLYNWPQRKQKAKVTDIYKNKGVIAYDIYEYDNNTNSWSLYYRHSGYKYSLLDQIIIDKTPINYPKETT